MGIKAILFDKDGTLLDFHATWVPAYGAAAASISDEAGRPELAERLLIIGGFDPLSGRCDPGSALGSGTNADIARLWAPACGLEDAAAVEARLGSIFATEVPASAVAVGDLAPLFARLVARGLRLGVATMDSEALARNTVSSLALETHVDFVCGYDSGFGTKPGPGMVAAFCAHLSLAPSEVLVVGDTLHDLHMGRAAGAGLVVGVLTGAGSRELLAPHCDHVLESVLALESII
ncbi:MAG: HAD-IA family hydrolase [Gammaproteobacteria bacterium]|nr:HAD family hydrolase [Gammaproteobacteria bacterium]NIP89195.1 HAD family hydrolase [Gammaproteobacteria bacterium]NIR24054.1 HAD family hydrolase [Gammaproteobacteria bacterium]NIS05689.1 HAD family hydrolase [Gammaproteobacteria bacterium]NIU41003.1 HAD-IA family hydrolase [Gammaproteobacteria bacterium]